MKYDLNLTDHRHSVKLIQKQIHIWSNTLETIKCRVLNIMDLAIDLKDVAVTHSNNSIRFFKKRQ